jgi:hypothetical protein
MQRLLQHVTPQGLHTIRYYGLYAPASKMRYQRSCKQCGTLADTEYHASSDRLTMVLYCKSCGGSARLSHRWWPTRQKGNSINKEGVRHRAGGYLQQDDEADLAREAWCNSS